MEEKYMVSRNGKQSGPYSIQAITNGIKSGKVQKSDHVWKEGMSEWEPITSISHFSAVFPKLTLPPPPPSIQTASASSPKKQAITKKIAIKDFEEEEENEDSSDNEELINKLNVSDSWKSLFLLVDKAGGPEVKNINNLNSDEQKKVRSKLSFNIPAFIFGPFYYFTKGMWKKGLTLTLIGTGINLVVLMIVPVASTMAGNVVFSIFANKDYYRKMVRKESFWW
jgi:hypothetical protein